MRRIDGVEPEPEGNPDDIFGIPRRTVFALAWILGVSLVVMAAMCNGPKVVREFTPAPTPLPEPTWTPVPTFTPWPHPTPTPQPIAELPRQQAHYNEYRFFHMLYEYQHCYWAHIKEPPPTPTPSPTPEDGEVQPTPTPVPTQVLGAFLEKHRPPEYGLTEREVEDHVLEDVGGATSWLIDRYRKGDCAELTQYTVYPGRLTWLHRYSSGLEAR